MSCRKISIGWHCRQSPSRCVASGSGTCAGFKNVPPWRWRHDNGVKIATVRIETLAHHQSSFGTVGERINASHQHAFVKVARDLLVSEMAIILGAPYVATAHDQFKFPIPA